MPGPFCNDIIFFLQLYKKIPLSKRVTFELRHTKEEFPQIYIRAEKNGKLAALIFAEEFMQMALVLDDLETSYNRGSLTEIPLTHAARISAKVSQYAGDIFLGVGGYNGTYYNGFNFLGDEWKTFRYFFPQIYEYMSPYTQTEDGGPSHVAPTSHVAQTPDISLPLSHGTPTSHVGQAPGASSPLSHVAPAHTAHIVQPQQVHESTDIDDDVLIIDDEVAWHPYVSRRTGPRRLITPVARRPCTYSAHSPTSTSSRIYGH